MDEKLETEYIETIEELMDNIKYMEDEINKLKKENEELKEELDEIKYNYDVLFNETYNYMSVNTYTSRIDDFIFIMQKVRNELDVVSNIYTLLDVLPENNKKLFETIYPIKITLHIYNDRIDFDDDEIITKINLIKECYNFLQYRINKML